MDVDMPKDRHQVPIGRTQRGGAVHQSPTRIQHASNSVCDAQGLKQTSDGFPRTDTSSAPRPTASALSEGRDRAGSDVTVRPGGS